MSSSGLSGRGLQQSAAQWADRGRALSQAMAELINQHKLSDASTALDVGCQDGRLLDALTRMTGLDWQGIDPGIAGEQRSPAGNRIIHGYADALAYPDHSFDVALFANVFEHVLPDRRVASLREMGRVLRPGGVIVGQIPNPYFLIESHSRLPLMGWLPMRVQKRYWRLAPVPWGHDFFVVTLRHVRRDAAAAGLDVVYTKRFNYPVEVIPASVQWLARLLQPLMSVYPWAWQFVLSKPASAR